MFSCFVKKIVLTKLQWKIDVQWLIDRGSRDGQKCVASAASISASDVIHKHSPMPVVFTSDL